MTDSISKKPLKKGSLVFVDREIYIKSIEALASDDDLPNYVFEGPGDLERFFQSKTNTPRFDGADLFQMFGLN